MPALVVPRESTPINMIEVTAKLAAMYEKLYGQIPLEPLLVRAAGVIGLENAGGASINNGNFGNITAPTGYEGRVWEANGLYFLDFGSEWGSLENGAMGWWQVMAYRSRDALVDAAQGNTRAMVRDMFRKGYVGTNWTKQQLADYTAGVERWSGVAMHPAMTIVEYFKRPWVGAAVGGTAFLAAIAGGMYWHRQRRAA